MKTLIYDTTPVSLHELRIGALVEYDGVVYKVFRRVRTIKPGGYTLLASARVGNGWDEETVGLYYANDNATVQMVAGGELP